MWSLSMMHWISLSMILPPNIRPLIPSKWHLVAMTGNLFRLVHLRTFLTGIQASGGRSGKQAVRILLECFLDVWGRHLKLCLTIIFYWQCFAISRQMTMSTIEEMTENCSCKLKEERDKFLTNFPDDDAMFGVCLGWWWLRRNRLIEMQMIQCKYWDDCYIRS